MTQIRVMIGAVSRITRTHKLGFNDDIPPSSPQDASSMDAYAMDVLPAWSQDCICGRVFSVPQAYMYHKRSCQKTKKRLSCALEKVKEVWQAKKRRKTEQMSHAEAAECSSHQNEAAELLSNDARLPGVHPEVSLLIC